MATAIRLADEVRQHGGTSGDFDVFDSHRAKAAG